MSTALLILVFSPLVGFLLNAFFRWNRCVSSIIGCSSVLISFISSIYLFVSYWNDPQASVVSLFPWIHWESLKVNFSFLIDPLSLIMILVITGVGFLIHLFSSEYMKNDSRIGSYFSYLNLFIFNMLVLVLSENLLLMFVGWEGVGLCSYLLIGFWFDKKEKALAGMKAFIANRIGDVGFLIGMFLYFSLFGSLSFLALPSHEVLPSSVLAVCLCLFLGAVGKSAQLPLYVWLPSAMAGPTPVSALIHAATMVTAGIYLVIRTQVLWLSSETALYVVGAVGGLTALLGAYLACKAWDVKKVLAYSTMSQLGYMFLALGVGAFSTALFHLVTHAFFKACLFLSAGSLIHGLQGEQDIRNMGAGLRQKMPYTFISFLIGALALMGLPPLSGFFSKDEILYQAFHNGFYLFWAGAVIGAGLTAFYTAKTLYYIFWKPSQKSLDQAHEGSWMMKIPLVGLAFFSVIAGGIHWPYFLPQIGLPHQWLGSWLKGEQEVHEGSVLQELALAVGSSGFVILVILVSGFCLIRNKKVQILSSVFQWNWSLDAFYDKYFVQGVYQLSKGLMFYFETSFLQRGIQLLQPFFLNLRKTLTTLQSGSVQHYLLFMVCGFLVFVLVSLLR